MSVKLDHSPFRVQIAMALAIAMAGVFLVNTLLVSLLVGNHLRQSTARDLVNLASDMAARLDQGLYERWSDVRILARMEEKLLDQPNARDLRAYALEEMQRGAPDFAWIGYVLPDGTVLQASGGLLEGQSVAARPWFHGSLDNMYAGDLHEALLLQRLLGGEDGEPLRFVDLAAPIKDDQGQLRFVLGAHLSWQWAQRLREELLAPHRPEDETEILVVNRKGDVILGPYQGDRIGGLPVEKAFRDEVGSSLQGRLDGRDFVMGYIPTRGVSGYPSLDWIVVAAKPVSVVNRTLRHLLVGIIAVGVTTILGGMVLGWLLALRVSSSLRRLTAEAKRIGLEEGATTLPRLTGSQEVVELSQSLRSLLRRLGVYARGVQQADARALTLAEQNAELLERATRDPLTGLLNRRAFLERAAVEVAAARRFGEPLGVIIVDIDHFKRINDTLGHAMGDLAIRGLADQLRHNSRETDALARFGGEEFVILLPRSDREAVSLYGEKLRTAIEATKFGNDDVCFTLTISGGCALLEDGDGAIEATIDRADHGLYKAKNDGRNQMAWG